MNSVRTGQLHAGSSYGSSTPETWSPDARTNRIVRTRIVSRSPDATGSIVRSSNADQLRIGAPISTSPCA
jgi:hypothetical protein